MRKSLLPQKPDPFLVENYTVSSPPHPPIVPETHSTLLTRILNASTIPLESKRFLVVDFNNYFIIGLEPYIPGELGVSEFSLKEGRTLENANLFDPRMSRLRRAPEMIGIWETIGLPKPMFEKEVRKWPLLKKCGTDEFEKQLKMLFDIVNGINEIDTGASTIATNIIFAKRQHIPKVQECLKWLMEQAKTTYDYKMFCTDELLGELARRTAEPIHMSNDLDLTKSLEAELEMYKVLGEMVLKRKKFEKEVVACKWHSQPALTKTASHCALNYASTEVRLILDFFEGIKKAGKEFKLAEALEKLQIETKDDKWVDWNQSPNF